jgi:hypothetical protein
MGQKLLPNFAQKAAPFAPGAANLLAGGAGAMSGLNAGDSYEAVGGGLQAAGGAGLTGAAMMRGGTALLSKAALPLTVASIAGELGASAIQGTMPESLSGGGTLAQHTKMFLNSRDPVEYFPYGDETKNSQRGLNIATLKSAADTAVTGVMPSMLDNKGALRPEFKGTIVEKYYADADRLKKGLRAILDGMDRGQQMTDAQRNMASEYARELMSDLQQLDSQFALDLERAREVKDAVSIDDAFTRGRKSL